MKTRVRLNGEGVAKRRPLWRNGFTLVELLIVISIMAIIIAIALPRFGEIGRGSKMRGAVNELRSSISLARQWAIAHREDVYLIVPSDTSALFSGLNTNEYGKALHAYAVYSKSRGFIKDWSYLPAGVYFWSTDNPASGQPATKPDCVRNDYNVFRTNMKYQLPFPATNSPTREVYALRIGPQGWPGQNNAGNVIAGAFVDFYLMEATASDDRAGKIVNLIFKGTPIVHGVRVSPQTGIVKGIDCGMGS